MAEAKRQPVTKRVEEDDVDMLSLRDEMSSKLKVGAGYFMVGGDDGYEDLLPVHWLRTDLPQLDYLIGGYKHPGVPLGRIIEIAGAEGAGKTTLAQYVLKKLIDNMKGLGVYCDSEMVFNPETADKIGLNMRKVAVSQPSTIEEVFNVQEHAVSIFTKKHPDRPLGVIWDSIASASTETEMKGDYGDHNVGSHAKMLTQGLRKFNPTIQDKKLLILYLNQLRDKFNAAAWGEQSDTPGGRAMKFYASVRIWANRTSFIKEGDEKIGQVVKLETKKNKVAPPFKVCNIEIHFHEDGYMVDHVGAVLDWLKEHNLIGGAAGRYELEGKSMYKKDARKLLLGDDKLYKKYVDMCYTVTN